MTFDPEKQPGTIVLQKQEDGNWKGWALVHGVFTEVRTQGPEYCLQQLITNDGK